MHVNDHELPLVYLAGPLFSEAELRFNERLRDILLSAFRVYLPQEAGLMVDMVDRGMSPRAAARKVFDGDLRAIKEADILIIVLDGRSIDEGAAFELGVAFASGITCLALQTDTRRLLPLGNNPMIECAVGRVFGTLSEVESWVSEICEERSCSTATEMAVS